MRGIGPRPQTIRLATWHETELAFYRYRRVAGSGITGRAQVRQGHVTSLGDARNKLQHDFYYVKDYAVWPGALICVHTVRVILAGYGAR